MTAQHPDNHYGNSDVNAALWRIADAYLGSFPGAEKLKYNDISLVNGGLFDVAGSWTPRPEGHREHRTGMDVDVRLSRIPETNRRTLEEIVRENGGDPEKHGKGTGKHYHWDWDNR